MSNDKKGEGAYGSGVRDKDIMFHNDMLPSLFLHQHLGDIKVLLFGTSIIRRLQDKCNEEPVWNAYLSHLGALNCGVGGDKVFQMRERIKCTRLERKHHRNLHTVLIHAGSNDAAARYPPVDVAQELISCISDIISRNPHIRIIVSSVLPRQKPKPCRWNCEVDENEAIHDINEYLLNYCKDLRIDYMNNKPWWESNKHLGLYLYDGVHLTVDANKLFAENMKNFIECHRVVSGHDPISPIAVPVIAASAVASVIPAHVSMNLAMNADTFLKGLADHHLNDAIRAMNLAVPANAVSPYHVADAAAFASHAISFARASVGCRLSRPMLRGEVPQPYERILNHCHDLGYESHDTDEEPTYKDVAFL